MDSEDRWYGDLINYGEASENAEVTTAKFDDITRLSGNNRYATAASISKASFTTNHIAVIANGTNYADALAGVPFAQSLQAPILLTDKDKLPTETLDEIKRLGAKQIIILGGTGAVSENVEKTLDDNGLAVTRVAGKSRFDTAVKIAEALEETRNSVTEEIFFASAETYADALSASTAAAVKGAPILYLSKDGTLNPDTAAYLESLKEQNSIKTAYVIGGTGAVSDEMLKAVEEALGTKPERIAGQNRYETCIAVNEKFKDVLTGNSVCVATGKDFPDALAGGVFAALYKAPLLLAAGGLSEAQTKFLQDKGAENIYVFGGTGAVSDELAKQIADAKQLLEN